jgi:hypothetical protein
VSTQPISDELAEAFAQIRDSRPGFAAVTALDKIEAALVAVQADNETLRRTVTNLEQAFAAAREDLGGPDS